MSPVRLDKFKNDWYQPGRSALFQVAWFVLGLPLLRCGLLPGSGYRASLLRLFGAQIGSGVVIKPGVRVKYPWNLKIGDHTWIGEDCWIDNLTTVRIGSHVCISQGVYFCTGNHDWTDPAFSLMIRPITVKDGAWAGAKSLLTPGIVLQECAIAAAGSVVTRDIPAYEIHAGNPAVFVKRREIKRASETMGSNLQDESRVAV
jgi:putative colanic acid biosynthesis acetyltransferase WcaF